MLGLISVFIGGSIGAGLRYLISLLAVSLGFSYEGTFVINILGCLFLGFVMFIASEKNINLHLKLFLTTGIAGGFTTFSTFSYEALVLMRSGKVKTGMAYMLLSLLFGLFATVLGMVLAKKNMALMQRVSVTKGQVGSTVDYIVDADAVEQAGADTVKQFAGD